MVGTWALFEREEPINHVVAHHLLYVLERAVKAEWVLAGLGVEDSKNVTLSDGVLSCLYSCWGR
jgi:hypothetical protein